MSDELGRARKWWDSSAESSLKVVHSALWSLRVAAE
jgi:hypothetical protein